MQIVIPMSGFGERFRKAGYSIPKPLIEVEGKPIIAHVIDMFKNENNFIFICNEDHLSNKDYKMREIINKFCPKAQIIGISPHKLGPVYAVSKIFNLLKLDEPVIVNYCDVTCYWDWNHFKDWVISSDCQGAIPSYKGFHPHSLGKTNYAYLKDLNGEVLDIQEKTPFTNNKMNEYASSGTYYFSSGRILVDSFKDLMKNDLNINGEYYVSLCYKSIIKSGKKVLVYPLQHFMQWGTPEDLNEYNNWSRTFSNLISRKKTIQNPSGVIVMPMAGLGSRFKKEGYKLTKPLISVSGKTMVEQSLNHLPKSLKQVFIIRKDMSGVNSIKRELKKKYPNSSTVTIDGITDGQASTALVGLKELDSKENINGPITFGACDNGVIYDQNKYSQLLSNPDIDIIVWGIRGYPNSIRNPKMYGWIEECNGIIKSISVKKELKNPKNDPIVIGTFTFRNSNYYYNAYSDLQKRNGKVNDEFYIDELINDAIKLGLRCEFFEVESYLCWGTPNDLKTFEYWQSCFHKWNGHPYNLKLDKTVASEKLKLIKDKYESWEF